jgi:hypothetical protein
MNDYNQALVALTRRPVEGEGNTLVAYLTTQRRLELTREADGVVSAWAVAPIVIAGRLVEMAALVGNVYEPSKVATAVRRAKALIAEVVERGSRAAPALGEGTTANGMRVYLYAAPGIDSKLAADRLAQYVDRNGIELVGGEKPVAKKAGKSKASAAEVRA